MAWIYKITHIDDGKCYIGQTQKDPSLRWKNYRYGAASYKKYKRRGRAILDAIVLYGIEKFKFEIIEECDISILNDRERFWISFFNTNVKVGGNGYNLTCGGQDRFTCKPQVSHKHSEETKEKIRQAHKNRSHVGWRKVPYTLKERQNKSNAAEKQKIKIARFSLDGSFIEEYASLSDAMNWLVEIGKIQKHASLTNLKQGAIFKKVRYGFLWELV